MLSQFVAMDSIASVYQPLILEEPPLLLYLPVGAIVSIALMNLITAVARGRGTRECATNTFDTLDADGNGEIDIEEMARFDRPGTGRGSGINAGSWTVLRWTAWSLDVDSSGRVSRMEFEEGLLSIFLRE
ncbi:hypothetical protein AK812_SmicGene46719, partial [Symbiodinium microadriaticum]